MGSRGRGRVCRSVSATRPGVIDRELDSERLLSFRLSEFTRCMRFMTFVSRVSSSSYRRLSLCARTLVISPKWSSGRIYHGVRYIGVLMRDGVVLKSSPLLPFTEKDPSSSFDGTYDSTVIVIHPVIQHIAGTDKRSSILTANSYNSK
jgi:hypothetical protein